MCNIEIVVSHSKEKNINAYAIHAYNRVGIVIQLPVNNSHFRVSGSAQIVQPNAARFTWLWWVDQESIRLQMIFYKKAASSS